MSPLTLSRLRHAALIDSLEQSTPPFGRSDNFAVYGLAIPGGADADDIVVVHDFLPEQIDNNIGGYVADELLPLLARSRPRSRPDANGYAYSEQETFERYVGAIVRSIDGNERRAWHCFYDNTLAALRRSTAEAGDNGITDFNASFRAIYARVVALIREVRCDSILDVATCFGFLPLYLAGNSHAGAARRITGCDLNPALVALAEDYRRTRDIPGVAFVHADILAADVRRDLTAEAVAFDVITAVHLLEHLAPEESVVAVANLWALTGRRLIVAVPFEAVPDRRFGHCQVFDRERLQALGRQTGGRCAYFEHHGGWLVVDRIQVGSVELEVER